MTISRAQGSLSFPANFMLVGAMNSCEQGYSQLLGTLPSWSTIERS